MTDREAFMSMIIKSPEDDAPRLVFADWLDERGESERAEFIRVQCEIPAAAHCGGDGDCSWINYKREKCRGCYLRDRQVELLRNGHPTWFAANTCFFVPRLTDDKLHEKHAVYHRGFVDCLACTWVDWLAYSTAILAATPLREGRLTTQPEWIWVNANGFDSVTPTRWMRLLSFPSTPKIVDVDPRSSLHERLLKCLASQWPSIKTFTLPRYEYKSVGDVRPRH